VAVLSLSSVVLRALILASNIFATLSIGCHCGLGLRAWVLKSKCVPSDLSFFLILVCDLGKVNSSLPPSLSPSFLLSSLLPPSFALFWWWY
jgi:hypothetical protein